MARVARIALDITLSLCQTVQNNMEVAWPYMKVECVPPMTMSIFNGPLGDKLESTVSGAAQNVMNTVRTLINNIDAEEERQKQEAVAATIAAQEKIKAEELKKKQAADKKALDQKKAKEAKTAEESKPDKNEAPGDKKKDKNTAQKKEEKSKDVPKSEPKKDPKKK